MPGRLIMLKWLGWGLCGLVGIIALTVAALIPGFLAWRQGLVHDLLANSTVVTTPYGEVEYAEAGQGVPLLALHGTPGGYDQIITSVKASGMVGLGARIIAPSRPGYLRTPLASGRSPADQARLYAALLDRLAIHKVVVLGISGGGPSALQFAMRYPDRCAGLILEEAVTRNIKADRMVLPSVVVDFAVYLFRGMAIRSLQAKDPQDPAMTKIGAAVIDTLMPIGLRTAGSENDRIHFMHMENWPINRIRCPTLILHGANDKDVPLADAEYAHRNISGSQLLVLPNADHSMPAVQYRELNVLISHFISKVKI